jgi:hypothetical protein
MDVRTCFLPHGQRVRIVAAMPFPIAPKTITAESACQRMLIWNVRTFSSRAFLSWVAL